MKKAIVTAMMVLMTACAQPIDSDTDTDTHMVYDENDTSALGMCEQDVNELLEENAAKDEMIAELRAIINKQLVESHDYRAALIECGCSMEGQ